MHRCLLYPPCGSAVGREAQTLGCSFPGRTPSEPGTWECRLSGPSGTGSCLPALCRKITSRGEVDGWRQKFHYWRSTWFWEEYLKCICPRISKTVLSCLYSLTKKDEETLPGRFQTLKNREDMLTKTKRTVLHEQDAGYNRRRAHMVTAALLIRSTVVENRLWCDI